MRLDGFTGLMGLLVVGLLVYVSYQMGKNQVLG